MRLSPYIFIFFLNNEASQEQEIVLWDYKKHQQFILDTDYIQRLVEFAKIPVFETNNPIDRHFLEEGIFVDDDLNIAPWGWDVIAQIFHIGTQDVPIGYALNNFDEYIHGYIQTCERQVKAAQVNIRTEKKGQCYTLPVPDLHCLNQKTVFSALMDRMTSRFFEPVPLSLVEVSHLLYATFGQIHSDGYDFDALGLQTTAIRKSSPSAGGLHASEAYVVAMNITGLPQGIYHYRSHEHVLTLISADFKANQLGRLLCGQQFAEALPLGIFITSRLDKLWDKYPHSRAYRVALLDIGHLSQTFHLCATTMGLESWLTGVFLDTEINQLLNINETSEQMMFFVGAGRGRRQFLDEKTIQFLKTPSLSEPVA